MALDNITIADGQGTPVNHTFVFLSTQGSRVIRGDLAATPETPLILSMAHSDGKRSGVVVKSHLLRIDQTILDTDGVTPYTANVRLMADIPTRVLSDALADDFAAYIRNWATSTNVRNWLKGSSG